MQSKHPHLVKVTGRSVAGDAKSFWQVGPFDKMKGKDEMKIEAKFTHDKVNHAEENEIHAVVTLKAPKIDWEKDRAPICIIPVIDCSTSMGGPKIEFAKQSVMRLVENLQPGDYCGLVAFDSGISAIAEPREMTQAGKDKLKAAVGQLRSTGMTNFSGGMRQALEWINNTDLADKYILRVMMFTDGMPNQGEACDSQSLNNLLDQLKGKATLSAFGYGEDCDQELLADLAKRGDGSYYFVRNPDDALTAFARELGGLLSRYAHDIVIDVAPFNGHEIVEVLSDVEVEVDGRKMKVTLPEILSEEERHTVFVLKLSKQKKPPPRALNVLDIKVTYSCIEDGEKISHEKKLKAKVKFVKPGDEQTDANDEVAAIVALHKTVQAQIQAEEHAKVGNYAGAQACMVANAGWISDNFNQPELAMFSASLGDKMGSQATYTSNSGYLNSSKGLSRGVSAGNYDALSQDVDHFIPMQANAAMNCMVDNFTADQPDVVNGMVGGTPAAWGQADCLSPLGQGKSAQGDFVVETSVAPAKPKKKAKKNRKKGKSKSKSARW